VPINCGSRASLRAPRARLQTHAQAPGALPHRLRGRISHLKRRYGLSRSRLKANDGQQTWTGWVILAYNLDAYHHYAA
jgi:IS5 family transposase